eukprot:273244-Pelagomonas_calceolata.AAC.7
MGLARAVEELEALMAIAPGEASVYFQVSLLSGQSFGRPGKPRSEHQEVLGGCLYTVDASGTMGKLYKRLGNLGAAQRQLETALSLNSASSADAGLIKVAIEKLSVNDEEEEEEL